MLDVNIEFVKGVLFVRLDGKLNVDNTKEIESNLKEIITLGGIKYLVFNISNSVLEERIDLFEECNTLIENNDGKMFICGLKSKIECIVSSNFDVCKKVKNELSALKKVDVC